MANTGKKRASTGASGSNSNKKQKIANKQASSKYKGKAPSTASKLGNKQKSVDDYSSFGGRAEESGRNNNKKSGRDAATTADQPAKPKLLRDKKGKATIKEFVELPAHLKNKIKEKRDDSASDEDSDDESEPDYREELGIEDMLNSDSDNEDSDPASGTSSNKHDFARGAQFLSKLNMKELSRSRAHLLSEHRASKPETSSSQRHKQLPKIARAVNQVNSDDEENLDELDEDDFANVNKDKDSDFDEDEDDSMDDELSVMSDAAGGVDAGEEVDFSSDEDDSDLDEDDDDDDASLASDDEDAWSGIDDDDDDDDSAESGSSHTLSDNEDLEMKYATQHTKKAKRAELEAQARRTKLPVFGAKEEDDEEDDDESEEEDSEEGEDLDLDEEAEEEAAPRESKKAAKSKEKERKSRVAHAPVNLSDASDDEETIERKKLKAAKASQPKPNPMGARFGRPAVSDLLEMDDRMERFQAAREEMAVLGREIMAEPELGMNLLKRLLSFTMPVFYPNSGEKREEGIPVDYPIRSLAMLSLLAVFLDILPGYRIRPVTDKEKAARATQAVLQQRDFEEGLVNCYRRYLETCEAEVKANSPIAPVALKCLCEMLKEKSHFNFATNILEVLVKTLGRRKFDTSSELCVTSLASIVREDTTGNMSLHTVRLLSRTVKARGYHIHPAALACLLSLRFPDMGVRASRDSVDRPTYDRRQPAFNKKGKIVDKQYMNKKARKALREKKEIEKEMAEAENEMKSEEVTRNSTETLKLLFALYFRILKMPLAKEDEGRPKSLADKKKMEELLPAALEGLTRFAHLVNVDFFRDLLDVLRQVSAVCHDSRTQLLCIGTALDLLSGQGEALNIDLGDLVSRLYAILIPLTIDVTLEEKPSAFYPPTLQRTLKALSTSSYSNQTSADVLFRTLAGLFLKTRMPNPQARVLAFSKRLLVASLHWPKQSALRCLGFLRALLVRERCLETMLRSEDRRRDGVYRYEADQEGLANTEATVWWELALLEQHHYDEEVRAEANRLSRWSKDE